MLFVNPIQYVICLPYSVYQKQERMAFHRGGISLLTINETFHSLQEN